MQVTLLTILSFLVSFSYAFSIPTVGNFGSHSSGNTFGGAFASHTAPELTTHADDVTNSNAGHFAGVSSISTSPYVAVAISGASSSSNCGTAATVVGESGKTVAVKSQQHCANHCVSSETCKSFSFSHTTSTCTIFSKHVNTLAVRSGKTAHTKVYDRSCYHRTNPTPTGPTMTMGANVMHARKRANAHMEDFVVEALSGL